MKTEIRVDLPSEMGDEIRRFLSLENNDLSRLHGLLAVNSSSLNRDAIALILSGEFGDEIGNSLASFLVAMKTVAAHPELSFDDVVSAFTDGLKRLGWTTADLKVFSDKMPLLEEVLHIQGFETAAHEVTAQSYFMPRLQSLSIEPVIKPVFSSDEASVVGLYAISQVKIVIDNPVGESKEFVAFLDRKQLKRLSAEIIKSIKRIDLFADKSSLNYSEVTIIGNSGSLDEEG